MASGNGGSYLPGTIDYSTMGGFNYTMSHGWMNKASNFDNIGNSILTLFEMATLENWAEVMLL